MPGLLVGIAVGLYVFTLLTSESWRNGSACWSSATVSIRSGARSARPPSRSCRRASRPSSAGFGGGMTGTVVGTMGSVFFAIYFDAIGSPRTTTAPP